MEKETNFGPKKEKKKENPIPRNPEISNDVKLGFKALKFPGVNPIKEI
jgi:hypothetical protein